jgi:hypothetical protein
MAYVDSTEDPQIQIVRMTKTTPTQQWYRQLEASRENCREEKDNQRTA